MEQWRVSHVTQTDTPPGSVTELEKLQGERIILNINLLVKNYW